MIPTHDLLRLLDRIIDADDLRADPTRLTRGVTIVDAVDTIDPQSFATLARIAAGEAWADWDRESVDVPATMLNERAIRLAVGLLEQEPGYPHHEEARSLRRLEQFVRTL